MFSLFWAAGVQIEESAQKIFEREKVLLLEGLEQHSKTPAAQKMLEKRNIQLLRLKGY